MWILGRTAGEPRVSLKIELPPGVYFAPRYYDVEKLAVLARLLADIAPKVRDAAVLTWKQADTLEALARVRGIDQRTGALWALHGDAGDPLSFGPGEMMPLMATRFPSLRPKWVLILDPDAPAYTLGWFGAHVKMPLVSWLGRLLNDERHPLHVAGVDRIDMQAFGQVTSDPLEMLEILEAAVEHRLTYAVSVEVPVQEIASPNRVYVEASDWARSLRVAAAQQLARRVNGIAEAVRGDAARLLLGVEGAAERGEGALDALARAGIVVAATSSLGWRGALARSVLEDEDGRILFRDALELSAAERKAIGGIAPRVRARVVSVSASSVDAGKPAPQERARQFVERKQAAQAKGASAAALAGYAEILLETNFDPALATSVFERAIKAAPNNADVLGSYADYLSQRRELDRAQDLYERAIAADPTHSKNLGAYAMFLRKERRDLDRAQELYERALAANPNNAINLGNYANFLYQERHDLDRAQDLYERVIVADPNHAVTLGNYASFLWEERRDPDRAQELYERAAVASPTNADILGNYASFLWEERRDPDRAQELYERAIATDPKHAINLGNYANLLYEERRDLDRAQELYERAIAADPKNANNLGNFAHFLFLTGRRPAAIERLREAIQQAAAAPTPRLDLASQLAFYRAVHLPEERDEALRTLHTLMSQGARSPGWDLRAHALLAEKAADPDAPLFFALAAVLSDDADPGTLAAFPRWPHT